MKKVPFVSVEQLEALCITYPTPFHLYDEKGIRETARNLYKAFSWNKGFKEYFALKATPNPTILKILHEEGCGCDCSSYTELLMAQRCGIVGRDIMFSSNNTPDQEFIKARELGAIINLDDISHIECLEKAAGIPEVICCRYNPGGKFILSNQIMDDPENAKYGMTASQIKQAYQILKEKGVKEFGIHAFLSSNTLSNDYYPTLARLLFEFAVELKNETGIQLSFINLSGGIGIPYAPDEKENDIFKIGEGVHQAFDEILVPNGLTDIKIYTELGRYMLASHGHLVTRVIHTKHTYKDYIGVDASMANLMRPGIYNAYHHITVMGKENEPLNHIYDVTGSLCENCDKFAIDRPLPEINIGDLLVIHDTGAHGFSMGYNYNGSLRSAEILLKEDGSFKLIRRAETVEDYFRTLEDFW